MCRTPAACTCSLHAAVRALPAAINNSNIPQRRRSHCLLHSAAGWQALIVLRCVGGNLPQAVKTSTGNQAQATLPATTRQATAPSRYIWQRTLLPRQLVTAGVTCFHQPRRQRATVRQQQLTCCFSSLVVQARVESALQEQVGRTAVQTLCLCRRWRFLIHLQMPGCQAEVVSRCWPDIPPADSTPAKFITKLSTVFNDTRASAFERKSNWEV